MKTKFRVLGLMVFLVVAIVACSQTIAPTTKLPETKPTVGSAQVKLAIAKMVEEPTDREKDFVVVTLEQPYSVEFDSISCTADPQNPPFLYGPYDAVQHCQISKPGILVDILEDEAWLKNKLIGFVPNQKCFNGWVYWGRSATGEEVPFIEMFGFDACMGK